MDKEFSIFGFKFKVRNVLLTGIIACTLLIVLLLLDMYVTPISWYGVIMGTAFLVAIFLSSQLMKERGLPDDYPYDLIWWIFPLSIVGARLYYVLCSLDEFHSFYDVIAVWNGGLAIFGGVIGGIVAVGICCAIKKRNFVATLDVLGPVLIMGQAIGRWGNFINQEVFGFEVTNKAFQWFPIAVHINNGMFEGWFLATFIYESVLNVAGFFLLVTLLRKVKIKGVVTCSYLIYEGVIRFILEGLRVPEYILYIPGTNFPVSQAVSLGMILVGAVWLTILLVQNHKNHAKNNQISTN